MKFIDIIRTKSVIGHTHTIKTTCQRLNLPRVNNRTVVECTESNRGMLQHLQGVAIWTVREEEAPVKTSRRLHPPSRGYPRGIRRTGALTNEEYDRVLSRMAKIWGTKCEGFEDRSDAVEAGRNPNLGLEEALAIPHYGTVKSLREYSWPRLPALGSGPRVLKQYSPRWTNIWKRRLQ